MLVPMYFALGIHVSFTASWKPIILPALPIETKAQLSKDARELMKSQQEADGRFGDII